jgi:hypothetical protein
MMDLRSELTFAKQIRTCPPTRVAKDPAHGAAVKQHAAACPYCSAAEEDEIAAWSELAAGWKKALPAPASSGEADVAPGEIRFIRRELGRWRQNLYYTPPAVLVLSAVAGIRGAFRAAQLFFGSALAAPGDLVLEHARTGAGELMVECWNTYPVKGEELGARVGEVSDEVLAAVHALGKDPSAVPDWAVYPPRMREHDPRIYFRELEVEVSYVFASEAVSELMAELEKRTVASTVAEIVEFLVKRFGKIQIPVELPDPRAVLASVRLPLDGLAMAAAGPEQLRITANLIRLVECKVKEVRPVIAEILEEGTSETGRFVAGRVPDAARLGADSWLYCMLPRPGTRAISATSVDWDPESGRFLARFEEIFDGWGEVKLAVFYCLE